MDRTVTGDKPTNDAGDVVTPRVRPRVWPLVVVVLAQIGVMIGTSWLAPETPLHFFGLMFSPMVGAVLALLWWLFLSRVPVRERWIGLLIAAVAGGACFFVADDSMAITLVVYGLSSLSLALAAVLAATFPLRWRRRRQLAAVTVVAVSVLWATLRLDGLDGSFRPELAFRWSSTPEEEFLSSPPATATDAAARSDEPALPPQIAAADWPGFRGALRDGKVRGVTFATSWAEQPPRELWRRRVGPGWSSFAVVGDLAFTQEQRGPDELVVCYALDDGREVWTNHVETRFDETVGGPGPRATPTFEGGGLYTLGATGMLQRLDPATGERVWLRDVRADSGAETPIWGFSSSPLLLGEQVVVFTGAGGGRSVAAYDRASGAPSWSGGDGKLSYSSCHAARIGEVDQVLMISDVGLQSLAADGGSLLWEHRWELEEMARVVQPLVLEERSVLIGTGFGLGTRRIDVTRVDSGWETEARWTSRSLKPYFNDFVEHGGHGYGFDARFFACIDLADGSRRWKGGRYGHGQVLLVVDIAKLLVVTESGDIVLLEATPERHEEVARLPAVDGKTWNHPVIARDRLLVRNGTEAVCFELPR